MGIFDVLKSTADTLRKADKIEEFQQILSVQEKLLEMQKRILDLEEENKNLKEKLSTQEDLVFKRSVYYKESNDDGPFCQVCWDKDKKLIRLLPRNNYNNYYQCNACKNQVNITGQQDPIIISNRDNRDSCM